MRKKRIYDPDKRRERYLQHRERDIEQSKQYQREHKEERAVYFQEYYQKNKKNIIKRTLENRRKRRIQQNVSI